MSAKRKRLEDTAENSPPEGTPTPKRRKGRISAKERERISEENRKAQGVYNVLRQHTDSENRQLAEKFIRTPSRRAEPDYYKQVKSPIDFTRIQQKLKTEEYQTFEEFCEDVELLVDNTRTYYKEESEEHKAAVELLEIYKDAREKIRKGEPLEKDVNDGDPSSSGCATPISLVRSISPAPSSRASSNGSSDEVETEMVEDILCALLELTDSTGRLISPPFRVLQSKEEFPVYYEKIRHPMDLKTIAEKARAGLYKRMSQVEADVRLLCRNAQVFSGKGSEIYKDAVALMTFFKEKRDLVLEKGVHPKRRDKVRRAVDGLLIQAALPPVAELSEDSEEDEDTEESDDPLWKLYWTVRNAPNEKDRETNLSDPFLELPSRSYYPDYFDEISRPMSLFMINKKLKRNDYHSFEELFKDFMQVFENACEYNMESSDIFIAAQKLQNLTIRKARELQPSLDLSQYDKKSKASKTPKTSKVLKPELDTDSDDKSTPPPEKKKYRSPKKMRPISTGMTAEHVSLPGRPGRKSMDELMLRYRQKLMTFWDLIYNHKIGIYWPAGAFMELPSSREYPDYYQVIEHPIDMKIIRDKIENNRYESSVQLIEEFTILFNNARQYNEANSQIARDAAVLLSMVTTAHATDKDAPYESPMALKQKFGWLKTKLSKPLKSGAKSANGLVNGAGGFSDDDSSNSSVRNPIPTPPQKVKAAPRVEKKLEDMITRLPAHEQQMWKLYTLVRDATDADGRKLAGAFIKLPTKEEYPDYYEVIRKPMDLQRIQHRLQAHGYGRWIDLVADLSLMLENACKYNEPESTIYKDAVALQRLVLEKKRELGAAEDCMPRVQMEIRTMFTNIFVAVFSQKDADGRCRCDSFAELPDLLKARGFPRDEWPFSLDQIKRNIDKGRYRRLDRFQKDFFDLFERARELSRSDSKLFEDATELQLAFIRERDAQCKGVLVSTAFIAIENHVVEAVEKLRKSKMHQEAEIQRRESNDQEIEKQEGEVDLDSLNFDGVEYITPSYAYITRTDDNSRAPPHIMRIERIFKTDTGEMMVRGKWVYRPHETLHLANRKFIENEVFITPFIDTVLAERLCGKCMVVPVKVAMHNVVEGINPTDLFVCECRYLGKPRYFAKLKSWPFPEEEDSLKLTSRSRPLSPVRVTSNFMNVDGVADREDDEKSQTHSSSSSEEDDRLRDSVILDIDRPEIPARAEADADGRTYLHAMRTHSGKYHDVGQFVLVFNPQKPTCDVMRVDKLWREKDGSEWFSGGWLARPSEIQHDCGRTFYVREVFAVDQPDQTRRIEDIQSHCAVLTPKEFVKERPTEIPECDVFVCESRVPGVSFAKGEPSSLFTKPSEKTSADDENYDPLNGSAPMHIDSAKPLRKFKQYKGARLPDAELFIFKTPITMEKEMSPLVHNGSNGPSELDMELDENDTDGAESTASKVSGLMSNWLAAQPKLTAKSKSGYILFSAEIRKRIMHENPDSGFGEVSKIVGIEWKKLSDDQKRQYEVRAEYIASERAKQEAARAATEKTLQPGQIRIYQCKWINCDSQFDSENGLYEHIVQHHTSQIIMDSEQQYVCMWVTCVRNRKDGKPFPSLPRLHRHMKEKHLATAMKSVYANQIGKNFFKLSTQSTPNGETTTSLVHIPYGRGLAQLSQTPTTPQTPHVNGHANAAPPHLNGEHHYPPQMQQPHPPPTAQMPSQVAHQATPSCSQGPMPSSSMAVPTITDAGRTVVKSQGVDPVFVAPPSSVHARRVLHSETYLRYIESLSSNRQRTVSKWDTSLSTNPRNAQPNAARPPPTHWIRESRGRPIAREEDVVRALWRLRGELLESTCNMSVERDVGGIL
nr:Bromodomain and Bromo adjacent region and High mobility group and Zinc finger domain containing protein [Haemonchus contortus]